MLRQWWRPPAVMGQSTRNDAAVEVVRRYSAAFYAGDREAARRCLAPDFVFVGPSATFRGADAFLRASGHVAPGVRGVEQHKIFVDGDDVCVIYDLLVAHRVERITVAEWFRLQDGVIRSIRMIFDTHPFFRASTNATVEDPVCHMRVDPASAAATRVHAGTTYSFCSEGCAEAFERAPETYLEGSR
jgi:Cu+-exporting ATPase